MRLGSFHFTHAGSLAAQTLRLKHNRPTPSRAPAKWAGGVVWCCQNRWPYPQHLRSRPFWPGRHQGPIIILVLQHPVTARTPPGSGWQIAGYHGRAGWGNNRPGAGPGSRWIEQITYYIAKVYGIYQLCLPDTASPGQPPTTLGPAEVGARGRIFAQMARCQVNPGPVGAD